MHNLGYTRSSYKRSHLLQTPDTFIRTASPGMKNAVAIVHAGPQLGCGFTQYTVEFEVGGSLASPSFGQRFLMVLDGLLEIRLEESHRKLVPGDYTYLPQGMTHEIFAETSSKAVLIEKPYLSAPGVSPGLHRFGNASQVASAPLMGNEDLQVQVLIPEELEYDHAINVMTYQPGASLAMVEVHVMEHGLLMLEGEGIYRLDDCWYPVKAGDFIWMAPFCPQWFGALGKVPAKYLIYKDSNRHPASTP